MGQPSHHITLSPRYPKTTPMNTRPFPLIAKLFFVMMGIFVSLVILTVALILMPAPNPSPLVISAPTAARLADTTPGLPKPVLSISASGHIAVRGIKDAAFYVVQRRTHNTQYDVWGIWQTEGMATKSLSGQHQYRDESVLPETTYAYRAFAMNTDGEVLSVFSDPILIHVTE